MPLSFKDQTQLIAAWLEPFTPHTRRTYQSDLHRFQSTIRRPLTNVTVNDLEYFQETLRDLHPRSQVRIMASLSSLFGFAYRERFLNEDPSRGLRRLKIPISQEPYCLSQEQLGALFASAPTPRDQVLLRMLADTGLTVGEVCKLTWSQVHLERKPETYITVTSPQGVTRQLSLSADLIPLLQSMKVNHEPTDMVFRSSRSTLLHPSQVFRIVRDAGQRAHLPRKISPSCLRHSYARQGLVNGLSLEELQYRLGHQTLQPTMEYVRWLTESHKYPSMLSRDRNRAHQISRE